MMSKKFVCSLVIFLSFAHYSQAQGKIDTSKKELKKASEKADTSDSETTTTTTANREKNTELKNLLVEPLVWVASYTTIFSLVGSYKNENHLYNDLSPYPFSDGKSGNYVSYDSISQTKNPSRMDVENHFLYSNSTLFGNHFKFKYRPFQYFYFQGDYHVLLEKAPNKDQLSNLSLFHLNANYDRLRFERFDLGWTLGVNYVSNDIKKFGVNFGLQSNVFMAPKTSLYGATRWGWIQSVPVNLQEFQVRYHPKNYQITLGYEHLKIGTPHYHFGTLGVGIYL